MKHLIVSFFLCASVPLFAQNKCGALFPKDSSQIGLEKIEGEALKELNQLVEKDPDLKDFLANPHFMALLVGVAEGRSIDEMRPHIFELWKDPELSQYALGKKTGALLIGPNAHNNSKLIEVIRKSEIEKANQGFFRRNWNRISYTTRRLTDQILGLRQSLSLQKKMIQDEMNPAALDGNLFDFYGYLNLGLDASRLREWETPPDAFGGVKLADIKHIDPIVFVKVLMLASQIEQPIKGYSDASGSIFQLFPQATRFMGKTEEEAAFHHKSREKLHCKNSWCEEENRHELMLENLARRLVGFNLPNNRPFYADDTLRWFKPADVHFHVAARANNELAASSTYFMLGAHSEGNTAAYLRNIRGDEVKHSTVFAGLYHYLSGNTYFSRLRGVLKKMWIEFLDKDENSEYARVLKEEPIMLIEGLYTQVQYEKQIKNYIASLPLKTLRKFFETDINLEPLPAETMDPVKKQRFDVLTKIEKSRREALAGWPKSQREAAYKLEYFEVENNEALSAVIAKKFGYFKGAEEFGNAGDMKIKSEIEKLSLEDLQTYRFVTATKNDLILAKNSLLATLRDYQILNNRKVRKLGLNVQFLDAVKGFDIVKDEAFRSQKFAEINKPKVFAPIAQAKVISVRSDLDPKTFRLTIEKPEGFTFEAGDSVNVIINTPQGPQSRTLSISSSPSQKYLEFGMRITDSYFKEALVKLAGGDTVSIEAARKGIRVKKDAPAVFLAGGVGITPFKGILEKMAEEGFSQPVTLLFSNRTTSDILFRAEIDQLATKNPLLKVEYLLSRPSEHEPFVNGGFVQGRLDNPEYLRQYVEQSSENTMYYIVAPLPAVQSIRKVLGDLGVPKERIVVESFTGYSTR
jgi:glycine betaine catabolism B